MKKTLLLVVCALFASVSMFADRSIVIDFENDAIDSPYPTMHAWGWPADGTSAVVAANPNGSGNSLYFQAGNYDGVFYITAQLPNGYTIADIKAIEFETYFKDGDADGIHNAIEGFIAPAGSSIGSGTNFNTYPVFLKTADTTDPLQVGAVGEWFPISMTRENILDASYNVNGSANFSSIDEASSFMFGLGISCGGGSSYYLDNITVVLSGDGEEPTEPEEPGNVALDFEANVIGDSYSTMQGWGWTADGTSAVVAANPDGNGNSLYFQTGNYDGVFYTTVNLPAGSTIADIKAIEFETYFETGDADGIFAAIEGFIAPVSATVGNGTNFNTYPVFIKTGDTENVLQVGAVKEWFPISMTRENILDRSSFNMNGSADFSSIDGASSFILGLGISMGGGNSYYLDNITFVLSGGSSISVPSVLSNVYSVPGGIGVAATNETVAIYGFDGRLVKQTIADGSVISLNKGLYIVKVGSANAVKVFVK